MTPAAHSLGDRRGAVRDPELLVDPLEVGLHGGRPEVELARDVGCGHPVRGHPQDLVLTGCQQALLVAAAAADLAGDRRLDIGA